MMGSHAIANQYTYGHQDVAFMLSIVAACTAFILAYASALIGQSAILPLAAASVCAMACLLSGNEGHSRAMYALLPIGLLLCLAAAFSVAL